MQAEVALSKKCEQDLAELPFDDLTDAMIQLEIMGGYPEGIGTTKIHCAWDARRAIAGEYSIFCQYDEESNTIQVFRILKGKPKPPQQKTSLP